MLRRLSAWWAKRKPRPLSELLAVEFDEEGVRVVVLDRLEPDWNQSFAWKDVRRICFKDEGVSSSDIVFVTVKGRDTPVAVLLEARGGSAFFGALTERGLFPEEIWRKAMGETGGALHCWPSGRLQDDA
jgi:hypothetical protein